MREIVLDTETTGLDPNGGDRIVEIGCVELINHVSTGVTFQKYINPQRDMPESAFKIHGLSNAFLSDKPIFSKVAQEIQDFLGQDKLVIHNAAFDTSFLNAEFKRLGFLTLSVDRLIDTLALARQKYPGSQASLDALCRRFGINTEQRVLHGALLDASLLAEVYLELIGGRQPTLTLNRKKSVATISEVITKTRIKPVRLYRPTEEEYSYKNKKSIAHKKFIDQLNKPIWHS